MTPTGWTTRDRVMYITMQRPGRLNSLTPAVLDDFEQALAQAEADPELRAVLISGDGGVFCVGMDQDFLSECFADVPGVFTPFCRRFHRLLLRMEAAPFVVIAAVDGLARAGGFELLMACDLVLATTRSKVADHHIVFGMVPGGGATARAVRKLGDQRARELLLTGRWLQGQQIADFGVACQVTGHDALPAVAEELLGRLRPLSRPCLARMKRLVNQCADLPLRDGLNAELAEFADYHASEPTAAGGFYDWVGRRQ